MNVIHKKRKDRQRNIASFPDAKQRQTEQPAEDRRE
jgi:hypothetical protein